MKTASQMRKYLQALDILPGCKDLDRSILYDNLKNLGYRWDSKVRKWLVKVG